MTAPLFLGEDLRRLRAQRGLKQAEVARRLGIDASVVALWEHNKRPVPLLRVPALERIFAWQWDIDRERVPPPILASVPAAWLAERETDVLAEQEAKRPARPVLLGRCADPLCRTPLCQRWLLPCGCYVLIRQGEPLACRHGQAVA